VPSWALSSANVEATARRYASSMNVADVMVTSGIRTVRMPDDRGVIVG
jgi:hypothetical protein